MRTEQLLGAKLLVRLLRAAFTLVMLMGAAHMFLNPIHRSDHPVRETCVLPGCENPLRVVDVGQARSDHHQGWVLPAGVSGVDPGQAGEVGDISWWIRQGAVPVGGTNVLLDLEGGSEAVRIIDLTIDSTCTDTQGGTLFYDPGATVDDESQWEMYDEGMGDIGIEGEAPQDEVMEEPDRIALVADLDTGEVLEQIPYPLHVSQWFPGDPYFDHRALWIGPEQILRLSVEVTPRLLDCEYVLHIRTARGPKVWTSTIDDEGSPFVVGSIAGDSSGMIDLTRYERIHLHGETGWM